MAKTTKSAESDFPQDAAMSLAFALPASSVGKGEKTAKDAIPPGVWMLIAQALGPLMAKILEAFLNRHPAPAPTPPPAS